MYNLELRLSCVHRFGDYIGSGVVAPVRETAAQVLAVASRFLPAPDVVFIVKSLVRLFSNPTWHVRHGVGLGIKAVMAVRGCAEGGSV